MALLQYVNDPTSSLPLGEEAATYSYTAPAHGLENELITSQFWCHEFRASKALLRLPQSMFVRPTPFDMDDEGPVTVVDLVDSYDDEYDW